MRVVVTLIKVVRLPLGLRLHGPTGAFLHDVQRQQPKLKVNVVLGMPAVTSDFSPLVKQSRHDPL